MVFSPAVVTIGFDPDTYSVAESVGEAFVNISVLLGELQRAAEVTFSLSSGTAICKISIFSH